MTEYLNKETYETGFIDSLDGLVMTDIRNVSYLITAISEKTGGYDALINLNKPGMLMFLQFKVPKKISSVKARQISEALKEDISCVKYHMKINTKDEFRKHKDLLHTELEFIPCVSFYVCPLFNTYHEYNIEYGDRCVHEKAVYFSPIEIGTIPSANSCRIGYSTETGDAILYTHDGGFISHTRKVHACTFDDVFSSAYDRLHENGHDLHKNIDDVYEHVVHGILGPSHALALKEEDFPQRPLGDELYFLARQSKYKKGDKVGRHYDMKIRILMSVAEYMGATLFVMHPTDKVY